MYTQHEAVACVRDYLQDEYWMPPYLPASDPMDCPSPISTHLLNVVGVGQMATPWYLVKLVGAVVVEEMDSVRVEDGAD